MALHAEIEEIKDAYCSSDRVVAVCLGDVVVFVNTDELDYKATSEANMYGTSISDNVMSDSSIDCSLYRRVYVEIEIVPKFTHDNTISCEMRVYSGKYGSERITGIVDKNNSLVTRFEINIPEDITPDEQNSVKLYYWVHGGVVSDYSEQYPCVVRVSLIGEYKIERAIPDENAAILGSAVLGNMILGGE